MRFATSWTIQQFYSELYYDSETLIELEATETYAWCVSNSRFLSYSTQKPVNTQYIVLYYWCLTIYYSGRHEFNL